MLNYLTSVRNKYYKFYFFKRYFLDIYHIIINNFCFNYISIILSSLSYALSSKLGEENDKTKYYTNNQTTNYEVPTSEQLLFTSTNTLDNKVNISGCNLSTSNNQKSTNTLYPAEATNLKYIQKLLKEKIEKEIATDALQQRDSDGITYIRAKETNQTGNEIRHEFLNASNISASFTVAKPAKRQKKNEDNKRIENIKFDREEPFRSLNNLDAKNNNTKNSTLQQVKFFEEQNDDDRKTNKNFNKSDELILITKEQFKNSNESLIRRSNVMAQNVDPKVENQTLESRIEQENWEAAENDLMEAANFGLQAMHKLYYVQEPKLYSLGKY